MEYEELIKKHKAYIPDNLQKKIKGCKIFILGCGLGTQIALLAVRMGFSNFILIDGDKVSIDNMNRQAFRYKHLNENKAKALAGMMRDINPKVDIEYYTKFLKDNKLARDLIDKSDIVVNMADPDEMMYFVNNYTQSQGKLSLFPLNLVWGGYVLIFTPDSAKIEDIVGHERPQGNKFYFKLLEKTFETFPPKILEIYKEKGKELLRSNIPSGPQLGAAAYVSSAMVIQSMVRWLAEEPIKKAPRPFFLDLWEEI